jgi:hypothetical protein
MQHPSRDEREVQDAFAERDELAVEDTVHVLSRLVGGYSRVATNGGRDRQPSYSTSRRDLAPPVSERG